MTFKSRVLTMKVDACLVGIGLSVVPLRVGRPMNLICGVVESINIFTKKFKNEKKFKKK